MFKRTLISTLLAATFSMAAVAASPHDKPGFVTFEVEGRLWVFKEGSPDLKEYEQHGELVKMVTEIGVGPNGMTIRSGDSETIKAYLEANKKS